MDRSRGGRGGDNCLSRPCSELRAYDHRAVKPASNAPIAPIAPNAPSSSSFFHLSRGGKFDPRGGMGKPSRGFCRSLLYMKQILSSARYALVVLLLAVPASAQTRLKLPSNLFAVAKAVPGQPQAVQLPVLPPDSTGPRVSLTLEDAVKRALENNLDIAVQRIGPQVFDE